MNKRKLLIIAAVCFAVAAVLSVVNSFGKNEDLSNVDTVNEKIVTYDVVCNEVIEVEYLDDSAVCLAVSTEDTLAVIFFVNQGTATEPEYESYQWMTIDINKANDATEVFDLWGVGTESRVAMNIHHGDDVEAVIVNGERVDVKHLDVKLGDSEHTVGYWCKSVDDFSNLSVSFPETE